MSIVQIMNTVYKADPVYQWDKNQVLQIRGISVPSKPEIHFATSNMAKAIVRQADVDDEGVISVNVPNSILEKPYKITAYVCIYDGDKFNTLYAVDIPVIERYQPDDFIPDTEEEIFSYKALHNRIENLLTLSTQTEGNSELLDMRTGADGKVYRTAGEAVRTNITDITDELTEARTSEYGNFESLKERLDAGDATINDLITRHETDILKVREGLHTLTGNELLVFDKNKSIRTDGVSVDVTAITDNPVYSVAVAECSEGDVFTVTGTGGSQSRLWCFVDSDGAVLDVADENATEERLPLISPKNAVYAIFNLNLSIGGYVAKNILIREEIKEIKNTYYKPESTLVNAEKTYYWVSAENNVKFTVTTIGYIFPVKPQTNYKILVNGTHNRKIIGGVYGYPPQAQGERLSAETGLWQESEIDVTNTDYDHIIVTVATDLSEAESTTVEVVENPLDDYITVGANKVYKKENLDKKIGDVYVEINKEINRVDKEINRVDNSLDNLMIRPIVIYDATFDYIEGKSVTSSTGEVATFDETNLSDYLEIKGNATYVFSSRWTVAWYDDEKSFISAVHNSTIGKVFTSPENAKYLRFSYKKSAQESIEVQQGDTLISESLNPDFLSGVKGDSFSLEFSTVKTIGQLDVPSKNLCLIALRQIHSNGKTPDVDGYLYIDKSTNKLYYSAPTPDNPVCLCDWNLDIAGTAIDGLDNKYKAARYWHFYITKDGDIVCLLNYQRAKPIIYPNGNYNNPIVVEGLAVKPYATLNNLGMVQFDDGSFVFGEYTVHKLSNEENNDRRNIWKVTKPYNNPDNWVIEHSFKHVYFTSAKSDEPDNEIGHIHSVTYDFYDDMIYANTGDLDRHCRIWRKPRSGNTSDWVECVNGAMYNPSEMSMGDQRLRTVNLIYTKEGCIYATDSFDSRHNLMEANRDTNGHIDFSTLTTICNLETFEERNSLNTQATYGNILLRNPNGLLIIDRAEDREDKKLDVVFYSFDTKKIYKCYTFEKVSSDNYLYSSGDKVAENRVGLCNQVIMPYQPSTTDYVMLGGNDHIRHNDTTVFDNDGDNYVGALKLKIVN